VRTLCMLARQENGNERSQHVEQAKKALDSALKLVRQLRTGQRVRDEIEDARREVLSLGTVPG